MSYSGTVLGGENGTLISATCTGSLFLLYVEMQLYTSTSRRTYYFACTRLKKATEWGQESPELLRAGTPWLKARTRGPIAAEASGLSHNTDVTQSLTGVL